MTMCDAATDTCRFCEKDVEDCTCTLVCECGSELGEDDILEGEEECESCRRKTAAAEWLEATCEEVERLAEKHGWEIAGQWHWAQTGSRYAELTRGVWVNEDTDDEDYIEQSMKVRVSDHGSCYCSEDISIAMNPSGDDHSIETLEHVLSKPFKAD